jgi:hypothetical protein
MDNILGEIPGWARSCPSGKQKFASADEARKIFRTEFRRGDARSRFRGTMHVYRCTRCDAFHYTSVARRSDKKKFGSAWRARTNPGVPGQRENNED